MFLQVFAFDFGQFIGLAVLMISFLGWIVNLIQGDEKPVARGKPKRTSSDNVRSQLEEFLKQMGEKGAGEKPAAARSSADAASPPRKNKRKNAPKPTSAARQVPMDDAPARPLSERSRPAAFVGSGDLGQGLQQHVASYMVKDRVTAEAARHVGSTVSQQVDRDLGRAHNLPALRESTPPIVQILSSVGGLGQVLLMNEVLAKPLALRRPAASNDPPVVAP